MDFIIVGSSWAPEPGEVEIRTNAGGSGGRSEGRAISKGAFG